MAPASSAKTDHAGESGLIREMGFIGSFSMGFADVGASIFIALGLVAAVGHGWMFLAILLAGLVYAATGLSYAELSSAFPVAGGSSMYATRAFSKFAGFIAGWGLLLDYLLCIVLFALAAAGYLTFFFPGIREYLSLAVVVIVAFLVIINLMGIRESSAVNVAFTLFTIGLIILLFIFGLGYFSLDKFLSQLEPIGSAALPLPSFLNAITFAMVAFIGIESISQGAEETKNPEKTIPKAHKTAVFSVLIFALVISVLALGIVDWGTLASKANIDNPLVPVVRALTGVPWLLPLMAFAGFIICLVSSNTGVIGVSRVAYSMSQAGLLSRKFSWIHPKFHTPWFAILFFAPFAIALALFGDIYLLGELYAFGALTAYFLSNLSLILLRLKEPNLRRPYKSPFNIKLKDGKEIPLIGVFGLIGCAFILFLLLWLHEGGRLFAIGWFVAGSIAYPTYKAYREHTPAPTLAVDTNIGQPAILVPVKADTTELMVLDSVASLAKEMKTKVVLLHVIELPATLPLSRETLIALDDATKDRLDALKTSMEHSGIKAVLAIRNGRTQSQAILEYINDHTHIVGVYGNTVCLAPAAMEALRTQLRVPFFESENAGQP